MFFIGDDDSEDEKEVGVRVQPKTQERHSMEDVITKDEYELSEK
jgi:hypothetical protein